jgi:hypothetical protein
MSSPVWEGGLPGRDPVGPRPFRNAASFAGSRTTRGEVEVSRNILSLVIAVVVIIVLIWLILQFV